MDQRNHYSFSDFKEVIAYYLIFFAIQFVFQLHNLSLGIKYLTINKAKPKYKAIYYSSDEYTKQREEMEIQFNNWNMNMRRQLERMYRSTTVYSLSLTFQTVLLLIILRVGLTRGYIVYASMILVKTNCSVIVMHRLLYIKKADQYREWTR